MTMGPQRWGNGRLVLLFILSLLLFTALRWQPEAWVRGRIESVAHQAGIGLRFHSLAMHGLTVRMDGISLLLPGVAMPVSLDRLSVRPEWLHLLIGEPGGDISLLWHGQPFRFSANLRSHKVALHLPDSAIPLAAVAPLWRKALVLPVDPTGDVHLHGDAILSLPDGHPVSGDIELAWRNARASVSGHAFALGSYRLQGSGKKGIWTLSAAGGDDALLKASGRLDAANPDFRAWTLHAEGELSAKAGSPLAGMMGGKPLHFVLSGPAMSPQWHLSSRPDDGAL